MSGQYTWLSYAFGAALCAALVSVLGKVGVRDVNSDLATAVRSIVQAGFVVGFATVLGLWRHAEQIGTRAGAAIVLAGIAGGLSWIFMFRALQLAPVWRVSPIDKLSMPLAVLLAVILLRERPGAWNWLGIVLIIAGAYLVALPARPHP